MNKLPPLKPPDSWERQSPIPQRGWKRCRTTREEREREKRRRRERKREREKSLRGKKATTVGCPTPAAGAAVMTSRGHVTQALQ